MKKIEKRMHADKERVLDEVSCVDAATELGLMMKEKSGKVYLECPFHEKMIGKPDRHIGNCVISKDARRCYCYACNGSGDAIEMVMAVEGLSFCEATDWLAERRAPHLLEDENKKKTRRRKCPFSDEDFSSIGIHTPTRFCLSEPVLLSMKHITEGMAQGSLPILPIRRMVLFCCAVKHGYR